MSTPPTQSGTLAPLPTEYLEVLEFERFIQDAGPVSVGAKGNVVLEWFGFTLTRYHQLLNHALSQPAADLYDPTFVRRLRRLREARRTPRGVAL